MSIILKTKSLAFNNMIFYPEIEIQENTSTFIIGKSGCGKSTLLRLFNKTISPSTGEIYYNSTPVSTVNSISLRQEIMLVGQSVFLFDKSIRENFKEYYAYRDLPCPTNEQIEYYLNLCCGDFTLDTICTSMSGGERHRVQLAICISFIPKVLMLDEPTSALDSATSDLFMYNIKNWCRENCITLIVISHNKTLWEKYADNIITLGEGA